jgi:hypothetical protein
LSVSERQTERKWGIESVSTTKENAVKLMKAKRPADLFVFLEDLPTERVISGIYYSIRLLKRRRNLDDTKSLIVEGLSSEPTVDVQHVAKRIIGTIEETERTDISDLSDESAETYIAQLTEVSLMRVKRDYGTDLPRSQRLLEELRSSSH